MVYSIGNAVQFLKKSSDAKRLKLIFTTGAEAEVTKQLRVAVLMTT